jgi:hypothetical protein
MFQKGFPLFPQVINLLMIVLILTLNVCILIVMTVFIRTVVLGVGWLIANSARLRFGQGDEKFPLRFRPLALREIRVSLAIAVMGIVVLTWIDSRQKKKCYNPTSVPSAMTADVFGNNGTISPQTLSETHAVI